MITMIPPGESTSPLNSRRVPQQGLKKNGKQGGAAIHDKPQHKHRQGGEEEIPVFQQPEIHDGIFAREFPDQGRHQPDHRQSGAGNDEVRFKPVLALSLIQNHLQESQAHAQQAQPNEVDSGLPP